jgi:hypothetical protein
MEMNNVIIQFRRCILVCFFLNNVLYNEVKIIDRKQKNANIPEIKHNRAYTLPSELRVG